MRNDMLRTFTLLSLLIISGVGLAKTGSDLYQVDLILFVHEHSTIDSSERATQSFKALNPMHAVSLSEQISAAQTPYHLLPPSTSQLRNEYWVLNRKPQYQVLGHYSWLQPVRNKQAIEIPSMSRGGWSVIGTIDVQKETYYQFATNLLFTATIHNATFLFNVKQRLKPGVVYYLDHPQAGILVKIHPVT